jgi:amidase
VSTSSGIRQLAWAGAAEQARLVRERQVSAREMVEAALEQILALDPRLNAFRSVRAERALEEADALDPAAAGSLAGVPVAIKDDTDVAGELTCYGTVATDECPAEHDAPVVARLRAAGAVVVGKTHVPELDSWGFTESMAFGATRNPWDPSRTSGGSSGGSGVAAATGMCGVAHGTDGTGSLRNPASWLGIVGFKPGAGLIPGPAALSGWHGMVVNGPMARRAADIGAFLDATAADAPGYEAAARTPPPRLRIGVTLKPPPGMGGSLDPDRERAVHEAAALLRMRGHEVVEADPQLPRATGLAISARYYGGVADDVGALAHPERLESRTRSLARLGRALAPALPIASRVERAAINALDALGCDVLLFPGSMQPPEPIGRFRDRGALLTAYMDTAQVAWQPLWNLVGRPAVMVPWDLDPAGLPTAVQLGASPGAERLLVGLTAELESERRWSERRPPICD